MFRSVASAVMLAGIIVVVTGIGGIALRLCSLACCLART